MLKSVMVLGIDHVEKMKFSVIQDYVQICLNATLLQYVFIYTTGGDSISHCPGMDDEFYCNVAEGPKVCSSYLQIVWCEGLKNHEDVTLFKYSSTVAKLTIINNQIDFNIFIISQNKFHSVTAVNVGSNNKTNVCLMLTKIEHKLIKLILVTTK